MKFCAIAIVSATLLATPSYAEWFEGGSLHRSTVAQWLSASGSNRLATSGDWAVRILGESTVRQIGMDGLRGRAQSLSNCVSEAATGSPPNSSTSDLAAACAILLNW